jgi:hypothetical protein
MIMKCFGHTPKHPFPQRRDLNFSLKYEKLPLAKNKVAVTTNSVFCIITPPLSKNYKNCARWKTRIHRCTFSADTTPSLFIPNPPPSHQGKSLGYEWVSILDVVVLKAPTN